LYALSHTHPTFVIRVIMYTLPSIQIVVNSDISHLLRTKLDKGSKITSPEI